MEWIVHKFGGTSLATADCYRNSANLILSEPIPSNTKKCIVVSAPGAIKAKSGIWSLLSQRPFIRNKSVPTDQHDKTTQVIIDCTNMAASRNEDYLELLASLAERQRTLVVDLLTPIDELPGQPSSENRMDAVSIREELVSLLEQDIEDLRHILRAQWLSRQSNDHHWWFGYGEIWSARLMAAYLNFAIKYGQHSAAANSEKLSTIDNIGATKSSRATWLDARDVLHLRPNTRFPMIDEKHSRSRLQEWINVEEQKECFDILVVPGYIASTADGKPATLGRDGSDYTSSICALLLDAKRVTIWTDVPGVFSANPNIVSTTHTLDSLSYHEAAELAYFGAKVVHPKTMTPLVRCKIPLWIKNSFEPEAPGTLIQSESDSKTSTLNSPVKGLSSIDNLALMNIEGTGMIGVQGAAARCFAALAKAKINVVFITQAGSEHSICFAVQWGQRDQVIEALRHDFRDEICSGDISSISCLDDRVSCLAIVGDQMHNTKGVAAALFTAISENGINVLAIAQGSSERNISILVNHTDAVRTLQAVHKAFFKEPDRRGNEI